MRIATLLVLTLLAACAANAPKTIEHDASLGSTFTAALGKPVRMDGIRVEFTQVLEESRCPKHVTCVWAGMATVALSAWVGAEPHELALSTAPAEKASAAVAGYRIELLDLAPYPDATVRRASMDYVVTLRVTRVE